MPNNPGLSPNDRRVIVPSSSPSGTIAGSNYQGGLPPPLVVKKTQQKVVVLEIPLDTLTIDQRFTVSGNVFLLQKTTPGGGDITVKFDSIDNGAYPMDEKEGVSGLKFDLFYLGWGPQPGVVATIVVIKT